MKTLLKRRSGLFRLLIVTCLVVLLFVAFPMKSRFDVAVSRDDVGCVTAASSLVSSSSFSVADKSNDQDATQDVAKKDVRMDQLFKLLKGVNRKTIFDNVAKSIVPPPKEKTVFAVPQKGGLLSLAIIEPRATDLLAATLYNMAWVYGNTNASLFIFHGTKNEAFVRKIVKGWKNVELVNLGVERLVWPIGANNLLLNAEFYRHFPTEFVLTFQTDSLMRRQIDDVFFKYDYVGGPWHDKLIKYAEEHPDLHLTDERRVGNGGLALRRVSTMIKISEGPRPAWPNAWEDQWIALSLEEGHFPPFELAQQFAADSIYHPNPCGIHKIYGWDTISVEETIKLLTDIPGAELLKTSASSN